MCLHLAEVTDSLVNMMKLHSNSCSLLACDIDLCKIFECARLKFMVSGRSKQAYKHMPEGGKRYLRICRYLPITWNTYTSIPDEAAFQQLLSTGMWY